MFERAVPLSACSAHATHLPAVTVCVHNYPPRWNAAPNQELLVIRRNHQTGEVSLTRDRDVFFYDQDGVGSYRRWYAHWIGEEPDPHDLMRPFPAHLMRMWPISTRVNKPENDDPSIIEPIEPATDAAEVATSY
jgi:putative SOS response-associated peptidase YedK